MDRAKELLHQVRALRKKARITVAMGVNALQVVTNFEIGRLIVEQEQKGKNRAKYGEQIIKDLAQELSLEFGRGFSKHNLEYMRRFYLEYRHRISENTQKISGQLPIVTNG